MRATIVKSTHPKSWYADLIGDTFTVCPDPIDKNYYLLCERDSADRIIRKSDCVETDIHVKVIQMEGSNIIAVMRWSELDNKAHLSYLFADSQSEVDYEEHKHTIHLLWKRADKFAEKNGIIIFSY
jgi:hypothetical protein